jgi:N6-adenosine-specific RNA methylase IME4/ParB-like chromosome segregation protein Spo0J
MTDTRPIATIRVGQRYRKDLGDIGLLAESIREVGLFHPIVIKPDGTLIAGRRRLEACKLLRWENIPITVVDLESITRGECHENVHRKPFLPTEMEAIAKALEPIEKEKAKERQGTRTDIELPEKFTEGSGEALDKVAATVGTSRPTLEKIREIIKAAEEEPEKYEPLVKQMDETGRVDGAYKKLHRQRRREEAREAAQDLPEGTFNVILADPPWEYDNRIQKWGPAELHYPTLSVEDICDLGEILPVAANAVLFLWVTNSLLQSAIYVIDAWGFDYKTNIVWVKTGLKRPGSGWYVRGRHELCLICTKGSFTPLDEKISPPIGSVITAPVGEHSEKPEELYDIIERLYPGCSYLELFAREDRNGWTSWGNELS